MPELLQMKMKRVPVARICSASNSPPVPVNGFVLANREKSYRKLSVCAGDRQEKACVARDSARTIGSRDFSVDSAAAKVKPAAVALVIKLRRETLFPK